MRNLVTFLKIRKTGISYINRYTSHPLDTEEDIEDFLSKEQHGEIVQCVIIMIRALNEGDKK